MTEPAVDVVVRAALRRLPVPDHDPAFWDRLDAELRGEQQPPQPTRSERRVVVPLEGGTTPVELGQTAPQQRRSNRVLALVASAAAVLAAVAAASLVTGLDDGTGGDTAARATGRTASSDREGGPLAPADSGGTSAQSGAGSDVTRAAEGDTGTESGSEEPGAATTEVAQQSEVEPDMISAPAAAADAALGWLSTVAAGDMNAAWSQLAPRSQAHWGDDPAAMAADSGMAESYGGWADSPPDILVSTALAEDDEGAVEIVTMVADVPQDKSSAPRALVLPVWVTRDGTRLDPWSAPQARDRARRPGYQGG